MKTESDRFAVKWGFLAQALMLTLAGLSPLVLADDKAEAEKIVLDAQATFETFASDPGTTTPRNAYRVASPVRAAT